MTRRPVQQMHVERRQLSGAREWIDDAPRVSAAVLAELRAWAGVEDAAESERKSVRNENLASLLSPRKTCAADMPAEEHDYAWTRRSAPRPERAVERAGQMRDGGESA